ncbi:hypothetical protein D3C71_1798440 [compost metagenome]
MTANNGDMVAQPAVIPTKPPNEALMVVFIRIALPRIKAYSIYATAPAQAAKWVLRAIRPILTLAFTVDAALKPNHANQRTKPPKATKGKLCPAK